MKLSLTTPRGALVDTDVDEITAPGEVGELGILPGHVPLMTTLRPGVLWYKAGEHQGVIAIGEGFLQIAPDLKSGENTQKDRVLVLVDEAVAAADIDREQAARELADADRDLAAWKGELDGSHAALVSRRGWAQARLDAANRATPAH